ncbi:hypothetical protein PMI11_04646 [Rhizobium sp. CF142]|nr:hypothetical protein PMI11_04646 [Rhizobium sp. CF142]
MYWQFPEKWTLTGSMLSRDGLWMVRKFVTASTGAFFVGLSVLASSRCERSIPRAVHGLTPLPSPTR